MKSLVLVFALVLAGCATQGVPVKREWPAEPPSLKTGCPDLAVLEIPKDGIDQRKLSELLEVVTSNYAEYHSCRAKVDAWMEWYREQQKIFNESQ